MLLPDDKKKIDYCKANNKGICPFIHRVCDGLCNNCGLVASNTPTDKIAKSHNVEYFFDTQTIMEQPI